MTRTALVTGATGGIGRAFARALHERGWALVLTGRSEEKLTALSHEVTGGVARTVAADLGTQDGIDALVRVLEQDPVDLLVNNAGFGSHGEFATLDLDRELEELTVNVRALMTLTHAALRTMTAARSGAIVNIGSVAGFQPLPRGPPAGPSARGRWRRRPPRRRSRCPRARGSRSAPARRACGPPHPPRA